jgi:hypothetical protein
MNKKYIKVAAILLFSAAGLSTVKAQNSQKLGLNSFDISPSAVLEIESTTKGFLPPRMTVAERDLIAAPAKGLTVYNTTSNLLEVNTGTSALPVWKASTVANPAIETKTENYTATDSDYTILCDATVPFTLTLPAAADVAGKVYVISKVDDTSSVLTFSPALNLSKDVTVPTLNYAKSFRVQSNGTVWNIID